MSDRISTSCPRTCSGDMYATVPCTVLASVSAALVSVYAPPASASRLARPKSSTFACPPVVSMMFDGFRSRCTICAACAVSRASATSTATRRTSCHRHRCRIDPVPQRVAAHVLHGDERIPVLLAGLVDLADIGMVERCGSLGFTKETTPRCVLLLQPGGKEFQCDRTIEHSILRQEHQTHAASAEQRRGGERHRGEGIAGEKADTSRAA